MTAAGYEASQRYGLAAPIMTPSDVIARLNKETIAGSSPTAAMKARFAAISGEPFEEHLPNSAV